MSFNIKKCMMLHFGPTNEENPYYMEGKNGDQGRQRHRCLGFEYTEAINSVHEACWRRCDWNGVGPTRENVRYEEKWREPDMTTLEERRHQLDMMQTLKIVRGFDSV
jgi:hypothetical protein